MMKYAGASVSAIIAAEAAAIWELISDVRRHPEIAGSGQVVETELMTPEPIGMGSRFQSNQNINGFTYVTVSHVIAFEPQRRMTWRIGLPGTPPFATLWQYELEPVEGGTRVTNSAALPYPLPVLWPFVLLDRFGAEAEAAQMYPTMRRLATLLDAPEPTEFATDLEPPESLLALLLPPMVAGLPVVLGVGMVGWRLLGRKEKA